MTAIGSAFDRRIQIALAGLLALVLHVGVLFLLKAGAHEGSKAFRIAAHRQTTIQAFFVERASASNASEALQDAVARPYEPVVASERDGMEPSQETTSPANMVVVAERSSAPPILLTIIAPPERPLVEFAGSRDRSCPGDSMKGGLEQEASGCHSDGQQEAQHIQPN